MSLNPPSGVNVQLEICPTIGSRSGGIGLPLAPSGFLKVGSFFLICK